MGGVTVIFCGKSCDDGVVHFSAEDGAVGLDDDVVLGAEFDDWFLLAERMKLGVPKYIWVMVIQTSVRNGKGA